MTIFRIVRNDPPIPIKGGSMNDLVDGITEIIKEWDEYFYNIGGSTLRQTDEYTALATKIAESLVLDVKRIAKIIEPIDEYNKVARKHNKKEVTYTQVKDLAKALASSKEIIKVKEAK